MKLYESMMDDCVMLDKTSVPDELGGFTSVWKEGAAFKAAIIKNNTLDAKIAEKQGITEIYKVTVEKGIPLDFHDVFKRIKDGAIFRVTSNIVDSESPSVSSFQIGQVDAERWVPVV